MITLWCLHGFLGTGKDWEPLQDFLQSRKGPVFHTPHLLASPGEIRPFPYWARKFNALAARSGEFPVLAGYSMGGRLALHALLQPSSPWKAAVIVSAHPGLSTPAEREARLAHDEKWAARFEKDRWEDLVEDWNAQPVFAKGNHMPPRREEDFSRAALAKALRTWSLGRQEPLMERLEEIRLPLLWIAGKEDARYALLGKRAARLLPRGTFLAVPGTSHRVPWEAPKVFASAVADFLAGLNRPIVSP